MLRVTAARLVVVVLATAPPNLPAPLALMDSATPVEVLFFDVFARAILAYFLCDVILAFARLELPNLFFHLFTLLNHTLLLPL